MNLQRLEQELVQIDLGIAWNKVFLYKANRWGEREQEEKYRKEIDKYKDMRSLVEQIIQTIKD